MTTNMITAARLLGHKTINGRYQSLLALDEFPVLGHQMVSFRANPHLEIAVVLTPAIRPIRSTRTSPTAPTRPRLCIPATRARLTRLGEWRTEEEEVGAAL